jgi:glutathione-regulated potassium-efflux system ancillary protein KefG
MTVLSPILDAKGIAELLGLGHSNSVSTYQKRYKDMPRPVLTKVTLTG